MTELDFIDVQISADEGDYVWTCKLKLKNLNDYGKFALDDPFQITLGTEVYSFIVDSFDMSRDAPDDIAVGITGVSPGAKYNFPRADPFTMEWTTDVTAKDAAETALGTTIQWDILNWTIPAYRLSVDNVAPIAVVQEIAEAAGAIVESNLDGTLRVRYRHPVSVPDYPTTPPSHAVTERDDMLTFKEAGAPTDLINRVRVIDIDASYADFLEFVEDTTDPLIKQGELRAFPGPWRAIEIIDVHDTRDPGEILMTYTGVKTEIIQDEDGVGELIEIYGGQANTAKPIWGIDSVVWESANLGGIVYTPGSTTLKIGDETSYGLIRLRYTTKFYTWHVVYASGIDVAQFVMEDLSGD